MYAELKLMQLQEVLEEYEGIIKELQEENRRLRQVNRSECITANTSFDDMRVWISSRNLRREGLHARQQYYVCVQYKSKQ